MQGDGLVMGGRPFTRRAAGREGYSRRRLEALLRRGHLSEVLHGVLLDVRQPDTVEVRAACAALVLPPGAAVARTTAAWIWGIDCRPPGRHTELPAVEAVVPAGVTPVRRPGLLCYEARMPEGDVCVTSGVPCTTPLRTALDCSRYLPRFLALGTIDAMAHSGLVAPSEMAVGIEAWRGERNVDRARRLIAACEPRSESFGESWIRLRCLDAGFPRPEAQINLPDDERPRWRLDLGFREHRAGIEYDGATFHGSDAQRSHDERRRADCERSFGWTVHGFTKAHVLGPSMQLELVVGELLSMTPRITRRLW